MNEMWDSKGGQNLLCWNPGGYFLVPFVSCHHFIATNRILNALFQMNMLTSLRRKMTTFRGTIESVLPKILFSSFFKLLYIALVDVGATIQKMVPTNVGIATRFENWVSLALALPVFLDGLLCLTRSNYHLRQI